MAYRRVPQDYIAISLAMAVGPKTEAYYPPRPGPGPAKRISPAEKPRKSSIKESGGLEEIMRENRFKKYADRETLERIKRWPHLIERFPCVRIYSAEHNAFWRGIGNGYTDDINASAVWHCQEAVRRTRHCGPEKQIQYVSVE